MNLCADLRGLAALTESSGTTWSALAGDLAYIVNNDFQAGYLAPGGYALIGLMSQSGVAPSISGPAADTPQRPTVNVKLVYG